MAAHLADVSSTDEHTFISRHATVRPGDAYWIGLKYQQETYYWWDQKPLMLQTSMWAAGASSSAEHGNETCVVMDRQFSFKWASRPCSSAFHFICELEGLTCYKLLPLPSNPGIFADSRPWIEMDFNDIVTVAAIDSTGDGNSGSYTRAYSLEYSEDGFEYFTYSEETDADSCPRTKIIHANDDAVTAVRNFLSPALSARYLRIIPVAWHVRPAINPSALGCEAAIMTGPGDEMDGLIYIRGSGRYSLSFSDAEHHCASLRGELATPDQLREAFDSGYERAEMGWLRDGSVRYPIQLPSPGNAYSRHLVNKGYPDKLTTTFAGYCYQKRSERRGCAVPLGSRRHCGPPGGDLTQCEAMGCCYDDSVSDSTRCFHTRAGRNIALGKPTTQSTVGHVHIQPYQGNDGRRDTDIVAIPGVNIALGKTAFQSSTHSNDFASHAVDGNTDTDYRSGSCSHTNIPPEDNPSWWVDLGQPSMVVSVVIFNRRECCSGRLNPFNIHIGDSDQVSTNPKCGGDHQIDLSQPSITVSCHGMKGRYVAVRLPGPSRILSLCEVQVFSAEYELFDHNCYKAFTTALSWQEARSTCISDGGQLAEPVDASINQFLIDLGDAKDPSLQFHIGLHDQNTDALYEWQDGTPLGIFNAWGPGQPSDSGGNGDCVGFHTGNAWNDYPCSTLNPFICEISVFNYAGCLKQDYTYHDEYCYKAVSTNMDFQAAEEHCAAEDAWLAFPRDADTNQFLLDYINASFAHNNVWLGLDSRRQEFKWMTNDGLTLTDSDFTDWDTEEPDSDQGKCARISHIDRLWDVRDCSSQYRFVCQRVNDVTPWWLMDLERQWGIDRVTVVNSLVFKPERINPFNIHIGDSRDILVNPKCGENHVIANPDAQAELTISCDGMRGRYVAIRPQEYQVLRLAEVEVYPVSDEVNIGGINVAAEVNGGQCTDASHNVATCDTVLDGFLTPTQYEQGWHAVGGGVGIWIKIQLDGSYLINQARLAQRTSYVEQSRDVRLSFSDGTYQDVEMTARNGANHIAADQAYFDYFTLVPVVTDFVKITVLTVYTQYNNGFLEVQFITAFPEDSELNYALGRFRGKKNTSTPVGHRTLSLTASLVQCATACLDGMLSPCYSFNYFHGDHTCQLTDHLTNGADAVLSVDSDFYHHNVQSYRLTIWVPGERCFCVRHQLGSPPLVTVNCGSTMSDQTWLHTPNGTFMNVQTRQCLEILSTNAVVMSPCSPLTASKHFTFKDFAVWQVDGRDVCLEEYSGRVQVVECNVDPVMTAVVTRREFEDFIESDPTQSSMCESRLKLCQVGDGVSYRGTVSLTETGKTCQRWDSQTPHGHDTTPANYPSGGLEENYCRNTGNRTGVWCYTTDPSTRWELCDVPVCGARETLEQLRVCGRDETLSIQCPARQQINIVSALYGRTTRDHCSNGPIYTTSCRSLNSLALVRSGCQGMSSCSVVASHSVFGDPCYGTTKYLEVEFTCTGIPDVGPVGPVANLTTSKVSSSGFMVSFVPPPFTNFLGYRVDFRMVDSEERRSVYSGQPNVTLEGLLPGVEYSVNVTGVAVDSETPPAGIYQHTIVDHAQYLHAEEVREDSATLAWDAPTAPLLGYRLVVYPSYDPLLATNVTLNGDSVTVAVDDLEPETIYIVKLFPFGHEGEGASSVIIFLTEKESSSNTLFEEKDNTKAKADNAKLCEESVKAFQAASSSVSGIDGIKVLSQIGALVVADCPNLPHEAKDVAIEAMRMTTEAMSEIEVLEPDAVSIVGTALLGSIGHILEEGNPVKDLDNSANDGTSVAEDEYLSPQEREELAAEAKAAKHAEKRSMIKKTRGVIDGLVSTMRNGLTLGGPTAVVSAGGVTVMVQRTRANKLEERPVEVEGAFVLFPSGKALFPERPPSLVDTKIVVYRNNPFTWGGGERVVQSVVCDLSLLPLRTPWHTFDNMNEDILLKFQTDPSKIETQFYEFSPLGTSGMTYHQVNITDENDVVLVHPTTSVTETVCACNHMTPFGSDFATAPNSIDFNTVFSKFADLDKNSAVFSTVLVVLGLYLIAVVLARRKDIADVKKWYYRFLPDNRAADQYYYHITVHTGHVMRAGTESNVAFNVIGDEAETGVRIFGLDSQVFKKGSINTFSMAVRGSLGEIRRLQIWHDNKGGRSRSWYLEKVLLQDLQTRDRYVFICNDWLSADRGDGQVYRNLTPAKEEDLSSFSFLFSSSVRTDLKNEHLWYSIVSRPTKSYFTRVQRLSCGLCVLYTTMVSNAMWYKTDDNLQATTTLKLGPISFTLHDLYVSVMTSVTVLPINLLLIQLFKRCKPKTEVNKVSDTNGQKDQISTSASRQLMLPHWCVYVGWLLLCLACFVSAFFTILYSLEWGSVKANNWLKTFLLSFFQSTFVFEPVKIVVLAVILSKLFKRMTLTTVLGEDTAFDATSSSVKYDKSTFDRFELEATKTQQQRALRKYKVTNESTLKVQQKRKEIRERTDRTLGEITTYLIYVLLLLVIANGSMDSSSHYLHKDLEGLFSGKFDEVSTAESFWKWGRESLLPELFNKTQYNAGRRKWRDKPFISDLQSVMVGSARIRQLRVFAGWQPFESGWQPVSTTNHTLNNGSLVKSPWVYQNPSNDLSTAAEMASYDSGGYVAELGDSYETALETIEELEKSDWIDRYTRAIVVEFTVFNANVNFFSTLIYVVEFPNTGGGVPSMSISTYRLHYFIGSLGYIVMAFDIIYMLWFLHKLKREIKIMVQEGRDYLRQPWNLVEVLNIALSLFAFAVFAAANVMSRNVLDQLKKTKGELRYIDFSEASFWNLVFLWATSILSFLNIMKFLHLVRFNPTISILAACIRQMSTEVMGFFAYFSIVFCAFAQLGRLLLGTQLSGYRTFVETGKSLFTSVLGGFDFDGVRETRLGPIFLLAFLLCLLLVFTNILVAIINDALVFMNELEAPEEHRQILQELWERCSNLLGLSAEKNEVLTEDVFLGGYSRVEAYTCEVHDVIDEVENTTPGACAMACTSHGSCEAFVYIRALRSCSLLPIMNCPPGCASAGDIYGDGIYSCYSPICKAAIHDGWISDVNGGPVTVRMIASGPYSGSSARNGITSQNYDGTAIKTYHFAPVCGSTLTVMSRDRTFYSNNPYENFENCSLVLKAPDGYVLTMTVSDVHIVDGDHLEIYDGPSKDAPLLQRLEGTTQGTTLSTTSNVAYLNFISDTELFKNKGFVLSYDKSPVARSGKEFCPYGWWEFGESCYYFSQGPTTYETAQSSCRNMAAHLADVSSTDEHTFTSRHATVRPGEAYWIGLKYQQGTYYWWDQKPLMLQTSLWAPSADHGNETCVVMDRQFNFKWTTRHCSSAFHFICEWEGVTCNKLLPLPSNPGIFADSRPWIEMDFNDVVTVAAIDSTGDGNSGSNTRAYSLEYSEDGSEYFTYSEETDADSCPRTKIIHANDDAATTVRNFLRPALNARYLRIIPVAWHVRPAINPSALGCQAAVMTGPGDKLEGLIYIKGSGHHALSFSDAERHCASLRGELATPDQLRAAFDSGYERAEMGWLRDGSVRSPVQLPGPGKSSNRQLVNMGYPNKLTMTFDGFCYQKRSESFTVFALQAGGWCAGSADGHTTYNKYGPSTACAADGEGGGWANEVYQIHISGAWLSRDSSWVVDSAGTPWVNNGVTYNAAKALDGDTGTWWNPLGSVYNNWYIILDLRAPQTLTHIAVNSFGDTTHDIVAFTLQKSQVGSPYNWEGVVSVTNVQVGTDQRQVFGGFHGTARYWKFVITRTHLGYQPYLTELNLFGISPAGRSIALGKPTTQSTVRHPHIQPYQGNDGRRDSDIVTIPGFNIALGKTAYQTSIYWGGYASYAVDGNTDTNYYALSCTSTAFQSNPTWWVDLGQSSMVVSVVIFNRRDCCPERLNPFNIHIGDSDQVSTNPQCGGDHQIGLSEDSISVSCQGMKGRYVGVRLPGPYRVLTLCEVQVFSAEYETFGDNCYKAFTTALSWQDARSTCISDGGQLAEPVDTSINQFLIDLGDAKDPSLQFHIGLHDQNTEGMYEWQDGTPLGSFSAWGPAGCLKQDYTYHDGYCYKAVSTNMDFQAAEEHCAAEDAWLAFPRHADTNQFLLAYINASFAHNNVWLGLDSRRQELKWMTNDGLTLTDSYFTDWDTGEPDSEQGKCAGISHIDRLWDVRDCSNQYKFVCQRVNDVTPWWLMDLERQWGIDRVTVVNSLVFKPERINPFNIHIGDSRDILVNPKCGENHGIANPDAQAELTISCDGMRGRYVAIRLQEYQVLRLAEVEVYPVSDEDDFREKLRAKLQKKSVSTETGCRLWTGYIENGGRGYGSLKVPSHVEEGRVTLQPASRFTT
ncbi:PKD1L3 [Branchiostoma lanceolatum]|uniref:PKD1L3 protein n=1 Tax=Branchiostoma lanceolatum TaxID=7740 RepID=A0A8J9ZGA2_BRALA|nr:PKD1L3 [Branchiostoma lanceolatum]